MKTSLVTAPSVEPVDLEEVKIHLRIPVGDVAEDEALLAYLRVARERAEELTGRKLISQTWYSYFNDFPGGDYFDLPYAPLKSITSTGVVYTNSAGNSTTFGSTKWDADTASEPGRLVLKFGDAWPTGTLANMNPVRIEFVTGYSSASTGVPDSIKQAIKLMVGHWYENREETVILPMQALEEIPLVSKSLLAPYKMFFGRG